MIMCPIMRGTVALWFWAAMHRVMFWRCYHLQIFGIVALQAFYKGHTKSRGQIWVFAIGLLTAPPSRIAKYVDVWTPKCQTLITGVLVVTDEFLVFGARFGRDDDIKGPRLRRSNNVD